MCLLDVIVLRMLLNCIMYLLCFVYNCVNDSVCIEASFQLKIKNNNWTVFFFQLVIKTFRICTLYTSIDVSWTQIVLWLQELKLLIDFLQTFYSLVYFWSRAMIYWLPIIKSQNLLKFSWNLSELWRKIMTIRWSDQIFFKSYCLAVYFYSWCCLTDWN